MPQHQLLLPVARPVTVKQAIDDLPRIRSKLSRGDSVEAWRKAVQAAPSYVKGWSTENESAMIETMCAFAAAATGTTTGGAFISRGYRRPKKPTELQQWLYDRSLGGACQYEARSHMASDCQSVRQGEGRREAGRSLPVAQALFYPDGLGAVYGSSQYNRNCRERENRWSGPKPKHDQIKRWVIMSSNRWTPDQLKLAFHLYCQLPFGKLHSRNSEIIELAQLIGRTPSAVAMKLVNFASLDPTITSTGRRGLGNASHADRSVWNEFHANWDGLVEQSASLRLSLSKNNHDAQEALIPGTLAVEQDFTGETRIAFAKQRIKQHFFRRAVLSSYGEKCCISGVSDKRFLVASHIVEWSEDPSIRLHPGNGLCLSAIHDKAFDSHLFSLTEDYRVVLSKHLRRTRDIFLGQVFLSVEGLQITLPERFRPEVAFLRRHREKMLHQDRSGTG